MTSPILFSNPLNIDGMMKKVDELNKQEEENALNETEIKMFSGIAKGEDIFVISLKDGQFIKSATASQ